MNRMKYRKHRMHLRRHPICKSCNREGEEITRPMKDYKDPNWGYACSFPNGLPNIGYYGPFCDIKCYTKWRNSGPLLLNQGTHHLDPGAKS